MSDQGKKSSAFHARGRGALPPRRSIARKSSGAALQRARGAAGSTGNPKPGGAVSPRAAASTSLAARLGLPVSPSAGGTQGQPPRARTRRGTRGSGDRGREGKAATQPVRITANQPSQVVVFPSSATTAGAEGTESQGPGPSVSDATPSSHAFQQSERAPSSTAPTSLGGGSVPPVSPFGTSQQSPDSTFRFGQPLPLAASLSQSPSQGAGLFSKPSLGIPSPAFGTSQHFGTNAKQEMAPAGVFSMASPTPLTSRASHSPVFGSSANQGGASAAPNAFATLASQSSAGTPQAVPAFGVYGGSSGGLPTNRVAAIGQGSALPMGSRPLIGSIGQMSTTQFHLPSSFWGGPSVPHTTAFGVGTLQGTGDMSTPTVPFYPFQSEPTATLSAPPNGGQAGGPGEGRPAVGTVDEGEDDGRGHQASGADRESDGVNEPVERVVRGRGEKRATFAGIFGRTIGDLQQQAQGSARGPSITARLGQLPRREDTGPSAAAGPPREVAPDRRFPSANRPPTVRPASPKPVTRANIPAPGKLTVRPAVDQARLDQRANRFAAAPRDIEAAPPIQAVPESQAVEPQQGTDRDGAFGDETGDGIQPKIVGVCELMCPVEDRERRERTENISMFERPDPSRARSTAELAVKPFQRNVEQDPVNFRTMDALRRTQDHLRRIMDRADVPLVDIHKFLWDRYRGVRQDIYVQRLKGRTAIKWIEEHVRFMVLAQYELCMVGEGVADQEAFNSHLNIEQANKAIVTLCPMYKDAAQWGEPYETEAEFRSYAFLLSMGTHGKYKYDPDACASALREMRPELLSDPFIQRALELHDALRANQWDRFLKLAASAPYLQACLAHLYFPAVRALALRMLAAAWQQPLPLQFLAEKLLFSGADEAARFCQALGLAVEEGNVTIPKTFYVSTSSIPVSKVPAISAKARTPRSRDALGVSLGPDREIAPPPASPPLAAVPMATFGFQAVAPPLGNSQLETRGTFAAGASAPQPFPHHPLPHLPMPPSQPLGQTFPAVSEAFCQPQALQLSPQAASIAAAREAQLQWEQQEAARQAAMAAQRRELELEATRQKEAALAAERAQEEERQRQEAARARAERERQEAAEREALRQAEAARLAAEREAAEQRKREEEARLEKQRREAEAAAAAAAAEEAQKAALAREQEALRRQQLLEAAERRRAEEEHRRQVDEFTQRVRKRKAKVRETKLVALASAWASRARASVAARKTLAACRVNIQMAMPPIRRSEVPSPTEMRRIIGMVPRDNVVPGSLLRRPLFDVAGQLGPVLAAANPAASAAFNKIILLHPPDTSIWVHDTLLGLEGARPDSAGEVLQVTASEVERKDGSLCDVRIAVRSVAPLFKLTDGVAQVAGLRKAMVGATGIVIHIPWPNPPEAPSIIAALRHLLGASPDPGLRPPVLILTDEANLSNMARQLGPLLAGDAALLSRIAPLGPADPQDVGLPGGYLVQGIAARLEPQPQLDKAGGRDALGRSLAWLARHSAAGPRVQVRNVDWLLREELCWEVNKVEAQFDARPAQYIEAFQRALAAPAQLVEKAARLVSTGAWPPPEMYDTAASGDPELRIPQGWDSPAFRAAVSGALAKLSLPQLDPSIGPYKSSTGAVVEYLARLGLSVSCVEAEVVGWPPILREFLNSRLNGVNSLDLPPLVIEEAYGRDRLPLARVSQGLINPPATPWESRTMRTVRLLSSSPAKTSDTRQERIPKRRPALIMPGPGSPPKRQRQDGWMDPDIFKNIKLDPIGPTPEKVLAEEVGCCHQRSSAFTDWLKAAAADTSPSPSVTPAGRTLTSAHALTAQIRQTSTIAELLAVGEKAFEQALEFTSALRRDAGF